MRRSTRGSDRLRLMVYRFRRPLAAACAALAVLLGVGMLRPTPTPTIDVVVAARDLPPGVTVSADDITTAAVPPGTVGSVGYTDGADVIGRLLATGIAAGEPLTATRMATGVGSAGLVAGEVAVPVRLADAAFADLLSPGDVVDLVASSQRSNAVIAEAARVITVPRQQGSGFLSGSTRRADTLLLVAVPRAASAQVAAASLGGPLAAIVRSTGDAR